MKNHIENLLGLPMDVIFFHDTTIPLQKAICINDFGGTIYQYPFEYCLKEAEKSKVKDLAKKFKYKGTNKKFDLEF